MTAPSAAIHLPAHRLARIAVALAAGLALLGLPAAPAGAAASSTPDLTIPVTGTVNSISGEAGARTFLGGTFTTAGGRSNLAAFGGDGTLDLGFDAGVNSTVYTAVRSGSTLYIGGSFTRVNGTVVRTGLAAVDVTTGAVDPTFNPPINGVVRSLVLSGGSLYVGGSFAFSPSSLGFGNLATLDPTTGAPQTGFEPKVAGETRTMLLVGSKLYLGGLFTSLNTSVPRSRIAAVDATTGVVDPVFDPSAGSTVTSMALSGGVLYLGGQFGLMNTNAASVVRTRVAAVDPVTGKATSYDPNVIGDVNGLAVMSGIVYAGGTFGTVNGQSVPRANLAAFSGGIALPFNPGGGAVQTIVANANTLRVGGLNGMRQFTETTPSAEATTGAASAIAPASATLGGTVDPNGSATSYVFEYGTTAAFGQISAVDEVSTGGDPVAVSAPIAGLTADTTYYYRLVASSAAGTVYGGVRSFKTSGALPAPIVTTGAAASITSTSASLPAQVNPNGQLTTFTFEYGTTTAFGSLVTVSTLDDATVTESLNRSVTGLAPNTTYYYRAVATNASGTTAGTVMRFTTIGPGAPPDAVTGLASAITATGATLGGTVDGHGIATVFTFAYGTSSANLGSITAVDNAETTSGVQPVALPVSGLAPGTTYVYRLIATNAQGTSLGPLRTFTTAPSGGA